jgi:hypothetical protein
MRCSHGRNGQRGQNAWKRKLYELILSSDTANLFVATSEDLHGLVVFGKIVEEIADKLPIAIREILEASGYKVLSVTAIRDERISRAGFGPPAFVANASLAAKNDGSRI